MLGDPCVAIRGMAAALLLGLAVAQLNTFSDAFWAAEMGPGFAEAVTVVNPFYTLLTCTGVGLGVSANATVAYQLGKGDKEEAERLAGAIIELGIILSIVTTVVILALYDPLIRFMGADNVHDNGLDYILPMLLLSPVISLNAVAGGLLRSEGAGKKATFVQSMVVLFNFILDPILMYRFGLGMTGAGITTVIVSVFGTALGMYWFVRGKMSFDLRIMHLRADREHLREVLSVAVPRTGESAISGIADVFMRVALIASGGTVANMLYAYPWRYVSVAGLPANANYSAMVSVSSGNMGMGNYEGVRRAYRYALTKSMTWSVVLAIAMIVLAGPLMAFLAGGEGMEPYMDRFVWTLRVEALAVPCIAVMGVGTAILQSLRRSGLSLTLYMGWTVAKLTACGLASSISYEAVIWAVTLSSVVGAAVLISVAWLVWHRGKGKGPCDLRQVRRRSGATQNA